MALSISVSCLPPLSYLTSEKEIVGYIFRSLSAKVDPYRVAFFVVQYFCPYSLLCSPLLPTNGSG
jgi:hypothetical protein